jgi:hypothetical protein
MPLTNLKVNKAKPKEKPYKLADERGMYLLVHPKGGKWWRLDYRFQGKRKTLSLGTVPDVSLKDARKQRDDARSILEDGVDPSYYRASAKAFGEELKFGPQVSVRFPNELITPLEKNLVIASTAPRQGTGLIWNLIAREEKT